MSHRPLIDLWPTLTEFAEDIAVKPNTAKGIRQRGLIPDGYWEDAVEGAKRRGIVGVTYPLLARIAADVRRGAEGLDPDEVIKGFREAIAGSPCDENRSRSYRYGWMKGQDGVADSTLRETEDAA